MVRSSFALAAALLAAPVISATAAHADGYYRHGYGYGWRAPVVVVGPAVVAAPPVVYAPPVYYPPPAAVYAPPVYVAPPVAYAPAPVYAAPGLSIGVNIPLH